MPFYRVSLVLHVLIRLLRLVVEIPLPRPEMLGRATLSKPGCLRVLCKGTYYLYL
jgi:hypothetical protein